MKRILELLAGNIGVLIQIIIIFIPILFILPHTNSQVKTDIKSIDFKTLSESFEILSKENSIYIIPENTPCLNFIVNYQLDGIQYKKYFPNDVPDSILEQKNIIAIGLPNENSFIKKCLEQIPVELNSNSIIIGDNKFAGNDMGIIFTIPNPFNVEKECVVITGNLKDYYFTGIYGSFDKSFAVKRKFDGLYRYEDHLALGNFKFDGKQIVIDSLEVIKKDPQKLTKIGNADCDLFYGGIEDGYAEKLLTIISTMRQSIIKYGIALDEKFTVYIYPEKSDSKYPTTYTDAFNTFWSKYSNTAEELINPENKFLAMLAHETARLAFQPTLKNPKQIAKATTPYDDDWSHYFQFTVLIPTLWEELGANAWPLPFDYNDKYGTSLFTNIYKGCDQTYAPILYKIDRKYGRKFIANTINEFTHNGDIRYYYMEDFMFELSNRTKDKTILTLVKEAIPSYMEYTYSRRIQPLGFTPTLDEMLWKSDFTVESVESNSEASRSGLKPRDIFIEFNGYNLATQKNFAHRKGLEMIANDGDFSFKINGNGEIINLKMNYKIKEVGF